jgi:hypothetical protein
MEAVGGEL